jgi:alanine or glycine:cation symporter, AGCS family
VNLNDFILNINNLLWGWPMIIFVVGMAILTTLYLRGVQFRYFFQAWRLVFQSTGQRDGSADMTTLQAFLNTLSASIGNGSIAGMATAIYSGGPGAAIWLFLFGFVGMALRFAEVYLGTAFGVRHLPSGPVGGPMVYLSKIPGGSFFPAAYAFILLVFSLATGNAMQANSIQLGCVWILPVQPIMVALALGLFMAYVMFGGARRIVDVSMKIVPVKVGLFFISAIIALIYHYQAIIPAIMLMIKSAFGMSALAGGAMGYGVQQALRFGLARGVNASEAGIGTASVLFGGAPSNQPVRSGIISMLSSFITSNLVCFSLMLIIVASGVWNNGQTSLNLTISAYETVYGTIGGWIVTFLSITFGLGTIVAYAYIARSCWTFLTNGAYIVVFNGIFALVSLLGALARVDLIWNATDLINAFLLLINLFGVLYLLPNVYQGLKRYQHQAE